MTIIKNTSVSIIITIMIYKSVSLSIKDPINNSNLISDLIASTRDNSNLNMLLLHSNHVYKNNYNRACATF